MLIKFTKMHCCLAHLPRVVFSLNHLSLNIIWNNFANPHTHLTLNANVYFGVNSVSFVCVANTAKIATSLTEGTERERKQTDKVRIHKQKTLN